MRIVIKDRSFKLEIISKPEVPVHIKIQGASIFKQPSSLSKGDGSSSNETYKVDNINRFTRTPLKIPYNKLYNKVNQKELWRSKLL